MRQKHSYKLFEITYTSKNQQIEAILPAAISFLSVKYKVTKLSWISNFLAIIC